MEGFLQGGDDVELGVVERKRIGGVNEGGTDARVRLGNEDGRGRVRGGRGREGIGRAAGRRGYKGYYTQRQGKSQKGRRSVLALSPTKHLSTLTSVFVRLFCGSYTYAVVSVPRFMPLAA